MRLGNTVAALLFCAVFAAPQAAFGITLQANTSYDFVGDIIVTDFRDGTQIVLRDFDPRGIDRNSQIRGTITTGNIINQNGTNILTHAMINPIFDAGREDVFYAYNTNDGSFAGAPVINGTQAKYNWFALTPDGAVTSDKWNVYGDDAKFRIANGGGAIDPTNFHTFYEGIPKGAPYTALFAGDLFKAWFGVNADGRMIQVDYHLRITGVSNGGGDAPVPEPASMALLGGGLLGAAMRRRRA